MISIILSGEGHRDRGSPGGCDNQNDNGRWNGCCDKIRFCCLSAEGAGKPTSPYSTLISLVPARPVGSSESPKQRPHLKNAGAGVVRDVSPASHSPRQSLASCALPQDRSVRRQVCEPLPRADANTVDR